MANFMPGEKLHCFLTHWIAVLRAVNSALSKFDSFI